MSRSQLPALSLLVASVALVAAVGAQPRGGGTWPESSQSLQGVANGTFESMVAMIDSDPRFSHAKALLIARHGTLVGEHYFNGSSPSDLNDLRSVTKSTVSMAMGIAIARGEVPPTSARVMPLLPAYAEFLDGRPQADLRIEHLLTMQAGFEWFDDRQPWLDQLFVAPDLVQYLFEQRTVADPGEAFAYSTAVTQALAKILIEQTGRTLHDYVADRLFRPIGIGRSAWRRRPSGDHYGGLGMQIEPRAMLRLGQLAKQRGFWDGRQVVPRSWMNRSVRNYRSGGVGYGYQWWQTGADRFTAIGYGGQYLDIDRQLDTVVALVVEWNVPPDRQVSLAAFNELRARLEAGVLPAESSIIRLREVDSAQTPIELFVEEPVGGAAPLELAIERVGTHGALSVRVDTRNGTARGGRDYRSSSSMLRWEAGESGIQTVSIEILPDQIAESVETFFVEIELLNGVAEVASPRVPVRITESPDDAFSWQTNAGSVVEGESIQLTLERSHSVGNRTARAALIPVTADRSDLVGSPSLLEFVFLDGELTAAVTIAAEDDGTGEPTELLRIEVEPDVGNSPPPFDLVVREQRPSCESPEARGSLPSTGSQAPTQGPESTCLLDQRFHVDAHWRDPRSGDTGKGSFAPLAGFPRSTVAESVQATFFQPTNVELQLKMVDGRSINGSPWLYVAKLSDLAVWIVVTDVETGATVVRHSPAGSLCGLADTTVFADSAASSQALQRANADAAGSSPASARAAQQTAQQTDCPAGALCLHDRFEVRTAWETADQEGAGVPVPDSENGGSFWFFSESNAEVSVKLLDARVINDHFWFYSGALTDQNYSIEITDRDSGAVTVFENVVGDLCGFAETGTL